MTAADVRPRDAVDLVVDGAIALSLPVWGPCWVAGWLVALPARILRSIRWRR